MRELERQLFHAERLTTVGRLAAGIAHEINNPLEGMANYLSLAREALQRGDVRRPRRAPGPRQGGPRPRGGDRAPGARARRTPPRRPRVPVDLNQVLRETEEFVRSRKEFGGGAPSPSTWRRGRCSCAAARSCSGRWR